MTRPAAIPSTSTRKQDIFVCPACAGPLALPADDRPIQCRGCGRSFPIEDAIPLLFWPTGGTALGDVTDVVKAFYEATPFPNYDDLDSAESLRAKAERGVFARLLNEQIPYGALVLECGCGTGQLSNFLGLTWSRSVFATDICLNSLKLGQAFKEANDIPSVCFVQMNIFRPVFRPESFDFVISNGVLHHTSDPEGGFRSLLTTLKPGGFVIVGLYNRYGRFLTDVRRSVFRVTGDRLTSLDRRLRRSTLNDARRRAWFLDQYKHPHESKHTVGEVLRWFDDSGIDFVKSIPSLTGADLSQRDSLFEPCPRGSAADHFVMQLTMLLTGREGGFFVMIGRKRASGAAVRTA